MSIYLKDIPLSTAITKFSEALDTCGIAGLLVKETIPLDENACGRVLAESIWAKISSPHYNASAMDGFAVRAEDTYRASTSMPVDLLTMGTVQAQYIDTGDQLPSWSNAVIPIENIEAVSLDGGTIEDPRKSRIIRIRASVTPWSHVRTMGEDMVATQLVLPAGHTLRPVDLGAVIASGHIDVCVAKRPRVAILPTGSELVPMSSSPKAGEIIEFNSYMLAAQVNQWGGSATRFTTIPDIFEKICTWVGALANEYDLVLLIAGSSAGSEDYSAKVVEALGDLLVHGVAVRPGHPVIIGMLRRTGTKASLSENIKKTPIIGVPGYPVSAALTAEIFVEPLLSRWLGKQPAETYQVKAVLTRKVTSPPGDDDYMRVIVGRVGEKLLAAPLARGAGAISSLVRADGLVIIPSGSQGEPGGSEVQVRLYRHPADLDRTIFVIGSHDISLDILARHLSERNRRLVSANVGSQGGLLAIQRAESHMAGSHLLDPETGTYNLAAIHQYLEGVPVKVIALVGRQQGLIVQKGNPKSIVGLRDLSNRDIRFVNRQRGAGTRVLLDYHLCLLDISLDLIHGYQQEEYTHLGVASAVASDRADCGLGIAAAAQALGLDFIPLYQERYDLVIPKQYADTALMAPIFDMLDNPEFRGEIARLPGYDVSVMGNFVAEVS